MVEECDEVETERVQGLFIATRRRPVTAQHRFANPIHVTAVYFESLVRCEHDEEASSHIW